MTASKTASGTLTRTPTNTGSGTPSPSGTMPGRETCVFGAPVRVGYPAAGTSGTAAFPEIEGTTNYFAYARANVTCSNYLPGSPVVQLSAGNAGNKLVLMQIDSGIDVVPGSLVSINVCDSLPNLGNVRMDILVGSGCPRSGWPSFGCMAAASGGCPGAPQLASIVNWTLPGPLPVRIFYVWVSIPASFSFTVLGGEGVRMRYSIAPPPFSPTPTTSFSPSSTPRVAAVSPSGSPVASSALPTGALPSSALPTGAPPGGALPNGAPYSAILRGTSGVWTGVLDASTSSSWFPQGECDAAPLYPQRKPWLTVSSDYRMTLLIDLGEDVTRSGGFMSVDTCGSPIDTLLFVSETVPSTFDWTCDAFNDDTGPGVCAPNQLQSNSLVRYDVFSQQFVWLFVSASYGSSGNLTVRWRYILPTPSAPVTPSITPSRTVTGSNTPSWTQSTGATPSRTPTASWTVTRTTTGTGSVSTTGTPSPTGSNLATSSVTPSRTPPVTATPTCALRVSSGAFGYAPAPLAGALNGTIMGDFNAAPLMPSAAGVSLSATSCQDAFMAVDVGFPVENITFPLSATKQLVQLDLGVGFRPGGNLTLDTCTAALMDTILAVGAGCPATGAGFNCLSANDDSQQCPEGGEYPRASFLRVYNLRARVLTVVVMGKLGAMAPYTLNWQYDPPDAVGSPAGTPPATASPYPSQSATLGVSRTTSPTLSQTPSNPPTTTTTPSGTPSPSGSQGSPTATLTSTQTVGMCGQPESGVTLNARLRGQSGSFLFGVVGGPGQIPFGRCPQQIFSGEFASPPQSMFIQPGPQGLFMIDLGFTPEEGSGDISVWATNSSASATAFVDTALFLGTSCPIGGSFAAMGCVAANEDYWPDAPVDSSGLLDFSNQASRVTIPVVPGVQVYYALVSAWSGPRRNPPVLGSSVSGAFRISWEFRPAPPASPSVSRTPTPSLTRGASQSASPNRTATVTQTPSNTITPTFSPSTRPNRFQSSGTILALRVGGGQAWVGVGAGVGMPLFVDEYDSSGTRSPNGLLVSSLAVPTASSTSYDDPGPCVLATGSTAQALYDEEGLPSISRDGRSVVFPCYSTTPGSLLSSRDAKTVAVIGADGSVDLSTKLRNAFNGVPNATFPQAVRCAATSGGAGDAVRYYVSGSGGGPRFQGVWTVTAGSDFGVQVAGFGRGDVGFTDVNCVSTVYRNRLWASLPSAGTKSLFSAWGGQPTLYTDSVTPPGFASDPDAGAIAPYAFVFENTTSLWVAVDHDRATANVFHYAADSLTAPWVRVPADSISIDKLNQVISLAGRSEGGSFILYAATRTRLWRADTSIAVRPLGRQPFALAPRGAVFRGVAIPPQDGTLVPATPLPTPSPSPTISTMPLPSAPATRSPTNTQSAGAVPSISQTPGNTPTLSRTPPATPSGSPSPAVYIYGDGSVMVLRSGARAGEYGADGMTPTDGDSDEGSAFVGLYLDEFLSYRYDQAVPLQTAPLPGTLDFAYSVGFGDVWPPAYNGTFSPVSGGTMDGGAWNVTNGTWVFNASASSSASASATGTSTSTGTPTSTPAPPRDATLAAAAAFVASKGYGLCSLGNAGPAPDAASNSSAVLTGAPLAEGWPTTSLDGRFVVIPCYDAPPGAPYASSANKTIALLRADGSVDASTRLADAYVTSGPGRPGSFVTAVTTNGSYFYLSGRGDDRAFDTGIRGAAAGARTSTLIFSTIGLQDPRGLTLTQAGSGAPRLFAGMGRAETRTGGAVVVAPLVAGSLPQWALVAAFPAAASVRAFAIEGAVIFAADDRSPSLAQLWRWSLVSGQWVNTSIQLDGSGQPVYSVAGRREAVYNSFFVYAVTRSKLFRYIAANGIVNTIAIAPVGTSFRGVVFSPIDRMLEPVTPSSSLTPTGSVSASATITPSRTPSNSPTSSLTPTASLTSTATVSTSMSVTASSTATASATASVSATATATSSATGTQTSSSTRTSSPTTTMTSTQSATSSVSASASWTASSTRTASRTSSPTSSLSATASETATATSTRSSSSTATSTSTNTPVSFTSTPSITPSATETSTQTSTSTGTSTSTQTPSQTSTQTSTPTLTASQTKTPSRTSTISGTRTASRTMSISRSVHITKTATPSSTASVSATTTEGVSPSVTPTFAPVAPVTVTFVLSISAVRLTTLWDEEAFFNPNVTAAEQEQLLTVVNALRNDAGCFAGVNASTEIALATLHDMYLDRDFYYYKQDPVNGLLTPTVCPSAGPAGYPTSGYINLDEAEAAAAARATTTNAPRTARRRRALAGLAPAPGDASTASGTGPDAAAVDSLDARSLARSRPGRGLQFLPAASSTSGVDVAIEVTIPAPPFNATLAALFANPLTSGDVGAVDLYTEYRRQAALQAAASERLKRFINSLVTPAYVESNPDLNEYFRTTIRECVTLLNLDIRGVTVVIRQAAFQGPASEMRAAPLPDEAPAAAQANIDPAVAAGASIGGIAGLVLVMLGLSAVVLFYRRRKVEKTVAVEGKVEPTGEKRKRRKRKPEGGDTARADAEERGEPGDPSTIENPMMVLAAQAAAADDDDEGSDDEEPRGKGYGGSNDVAMGFGLDGGAGGDGGIVMINPMAGGGGKRPPKSDSFWARVSRGVTGKESEREPSSERRRKRSRSGGRRGRSPSQDSVSSQGSDVSFGGAQQQQPRRGGGYGRNRNPRVPMLPGVGRQPSAWGGRPSGAVGGYYYNDGASVGSGPIGRRMSIDSVVSEKPAPKPQPVAAAVSKKIVSKKEARKPAAAAVVEEEADHSGDESVRRMSISSGESMAPPPDGGNATRSRAGSNASGGGGGQTPRVGPGSRRGSAASIPLSPRAEALLAAAGSRRNSIVAHLSPRAEALLAAAGSRRPSLQLSPRAEALLAAAGSRPASVAGPPLSPRAEPVPPIAATAARLVAAATSGGGGAMSPVGGRPPLGPGGSDRNVIGNPLANAGSVRRISAAGGASPAGIQVIANPLAR